MSRFRVFAAGLAVAAFAILAAAAPASAHTDLVESSPKVGEALASAPTTVSLLYSAEVMSTGAVIVIHDAEGVNWAAGDAVVAGATMSANVLPDMPDAGYVLRWLVVTADGHPMAGTIPFTVGDGEPLVAATATDAATSDSTAPAAEAESEPEPESELTAESEAQQSTPDNGVLRPILLGTGGAVVAIALFLLVRFLLRRRRASGDDQTL